MWLINIKLLTLRTFQHSAYLPPWDTTAIRTEGFAFCVFSVIWQNMFYFHHINLKREKK